MTAPDVHRVLVTGATGYVGSRLVPRLLDGGFEVLAASRSEGSTERFPWGAQVETRIVDIDDDALVRRAVEGVDAVVYLVHSMDADDFVRRDRKAAQRVAAACEDAGVGRVVYLSGLVPDTDDELSDHLRSRLEVEQVLLDSGVPATVLRAAMVIGAGSTSFELLRRLSERVPLVTPVPAFMKRRIQPIAVDDVLTLLTAALRGEPRNRHYDVGGDQVLTYPDLLATFADVAGLRRTRVLVPWVPETVVGWACAAISGLPRKEVVALVDSLNHDMVCREDAVRRDLAPDDLELTAVDDAIRRSLADGAVEGTARDTDPAAPAGTDPA